MTAQTRLTTNHRAILRELADKIVDCPAETRLEESAYQRAAPLVRKLVEAEFPPAEMVILDKYEVARRDRCINVQIAEGGAGSVERFKFRDKANKEGDDWDDEADESHPLVPDRGGCKNRIYIANAKTAAAVHHWRLMLDALKKAKSEKLGKYHTFVDNARTFEQVLEVWPEAVQVSERIRGNLPVALNAEILAEITADSKRRMKTAA